MVREVTVGGAVYPLFFSISWPRKRMSMSQTPYSIFP
jgi:hypothetical protein